MDSNIKKLSTNLLDQNLDFTQIQENINQLYEIVKEKSMISADEQDIKYNVAVKTANGMALGTSHAAKCLLDYTRTSKLLKGFVKAIKDLQQKSPGETINIFYAGCGPYTPFLTMVAPLFSDQEIQFSLLEINSTSIEAAKILVQNLNLSAYVKEYYVEDAVTFNVPNADEYHILYSETLDALLYRESYVPILMNMIPQFNKELVVIPENVTIEAFCFSGEDEKPVVHQEIFNTRKAIVNEFNTQNFPTVAVELQEEFKEMFIETVVHVYDDIAIHKNESSLTIAAQVEIPQNPKPKKALFTYYIKPQVELQLNYDEIIIPKITEPEVKEYLSSDRIKLPFTFNVEKLRAEIQPLISRDFVYYKAVQLRAPAHQIDPSLPVPPPTKDNADGSWTDWLDTNDLKNAPYLNEVINTFKAHTTVNLVRLLRLAPKSTVQLHTDPTLALEEKDSMIRLTIPIQNESEDFKLNGTTVPLKAGECWYLRLSDPHEVINQGETERINLTIDIIPNNWIKNIILESNL